MGVVFAGIVPDRQQQLRRVHDAGEVSRSIAESGLNELREKQRAALKLLQREHRSRALCERLLDEVNAQACGEGDFKLLRPDWIEGTGDGAKLTQVAQDGIARLQELMAAIHGSDIDCDSGDEDCWAEMRLLLGQICANRFSGSNRWDPAACPSRRPSRPTSRPPTR